MRPTPLNTARLVLAAAVPVLGAAPLLFADTQLVLLTDFFSMLVLAIMWNVLAGYADIVTVGQHGFVGVGAYAFYGFAVLAGADPYLSLPLAGLVALIVAVPAMALVFRLRTAYLSIGTWVIAEVLMLIAGKLEVFRRRIRRQSAGRCAAGIWGEPGRPHCDDLLARLRSGADRSSLPPICCCGHVSASA